jgi:hypothetical protein
MKNLYFFPLLSLLGCGLTPNNETEALDEAIHTVCEANANWISSPTMPSEVPSDETFCDFYQFSWQWFLAQASPSSEEKTPVFMENRAYHPTAGNDQCDGPSLSGIEGLAKVLQPRIIKPVDLEDVQADQNALYDQKGNILLYNAYYSEALCDSTSAGFAPGTLEAKASWVRLPGPRDDYFTATVPLDNGEAIIGLAGLHLAIWTPNHPEMIWASWEHKLNAPLCNGHSKGDKFAFASPAAAACLKENKHDGDGPPPEACNSFEFNTPNDIAGDSIPFTGKPNNVCREYKYGTRLAESVNGNDNLANVTAIEELNFALVGPEGLLTKLPADDPMAVWANYEMIGALWTKDGANSGKPPVPSQQGDADPNSPQRGSLELANMSLETFQQGESSYVPNCFGCHNYDSATPLTVSHIQSKLISE